MEKMIATTRRMIGVPLPSVLPGTRLVWLLLGLFAVAAVVGGPAAAQDLSPIDTFFATLGAALTGPVSMMGLPLTYVVILAMVTMGGFIATLSFVWFAASALVGYAALRALAAWDPRIFDVILTSLRRTPLPAAWLRGKGVVYRA